jgi:NlpC/P60 family
VSPRTACAIPLSLLCLSVEASASDAVDFAASLIGRPYVWGAEGPDAFDCSGLTQYVYQEFGIDLPRRAISQSKVGDGVSRRLQRGDLVFFSTDTRRSLVTHVGIYESRGIMINASKRNGRVRRDDLDDEYWAERFMFARRLGSLSDLGDSRGRADDRTAGRDEGRRAGERAALRVLERVADALLRRPRR